MKVQYVLSPRAVANLAAIWRYLAHEAGQSTADRIEAAFFTQFEFLARYPLAGHIRADHTLSSLRFASVSSYVIAYKPQATPLKVVAILHGKRDIPKILNPSKNRSA